MPLDAPGIPNKLTDVSNVLSRTCIGDSLDFQRDRDFSTFDRDNADFHYNCAVQYKGAWWYSYCDSWSVGLFDVRVS